MTKFIDLRGNLEWGNTSSFFGTGVGEDFMNPASILHMIHGYLFYIILNRWIQEAWITSIILVFLHFIEDFLENSLLWGKQISLEGALVKISNCRNPYFMDTSDHDTLQNFIGDNIFFIIGLIIGITTECYTKDVSIWWFVGILIFMLIISILVCFFMSTY